MLTIASRAWYWRRCPGTRHAEDPSSRRCGCRGRRRCRGLSLGCFRLWRGPRRPHQSPGGAPCRSKHLPRTGPTDVLDDDEFAKYLLRPEPRARQQFVTPRFVQPIDGGSPLFYFGFDQLELAFVESFDGLLSRRGPAASRPPQLHADLSERLVRRLAQGPGVACSSTSRCRRSTAVHAGRPGAPPSGGSCGGSTRRELVASVQPRWRCWTPQAVRRRRDRCRSRQRRSEPRCPASSSRQALRAPRMIGGPTECGSRNIGRPIVVAIDGRRVGPPTGRNSDMRYLRAGAVSLAGGPHDVELQRGSGNLEPGDGAPSYMGPLALSAWTRRRWRGSIPLAPSRSAVARWTG